MDLSLVIPVYDEKDNVVPLAQAIHRSLAEAGKAYEILFVDDGSTDGTVEALTRMAAADPRVRLLRLSQNFGQTQALQVGIERARGAIIVTLDGDQQNDPDDIPRLVACIEQGYDLAAGWRRNRRDKFWTRRVPSQAANWCIRRFLGLQVHDLGCTLKAYRADLIQQIPLYSDLHRFIPAVSMMASTRITEIVVNHRPRTLGATKYGLARTGRVLLDSLTVKMLLSCAQRPLHWFGYGSAYAFLIAAAVGLSAAVRLWPFTGTSTLVLPGVSILLAYLGASLLFAGVFGDIVVAAQPSSTIRVRTTVHRLGSEPWTGEAEGPNTAAAPR